MIVVNGRHLSADTSFIEKRRRGLVRFLNALVRHPILCQEQLVVMFLTVPTVSSAPPSPSAKSNCKLMISTRNSPSGANKPPSPSKKNSPTNRSPSNSKTHSPKTSLTHSTLSALASVKPLSTTSAYATSWNGSRSELRALQPTISASHRLYSLSLKRLQAPTLSTPMTSPY